MGSLEPDIDYYWEDGKMVFTAHYHLRRGFCCGSGCRHCPYSKKVVSLVPSWTETLLESGVQVVGRSRFCIHPEAKVKDIPILGGTKNADWEKLEGLGAEIVLLDREENTLQMYQSCPLPCAVTHIRSVVDMPEALEFLSKELKAPSLKVLSQRWQKVIGGAKADPQAEKVLRGWQELPGVLEWLTVPKSEPKHYAYVIWQKPWMGVRSTTFIGSVFSLLGYELSCGQKEGGSLYPEVEIPQDFDPHSTCLLFSSEPFPFAKHKEKLKEQLTGLGFAGALVDGEAYSWFGLRSLGFLERELDRRRN